MYYYYSFVFVHDTAKFTYAVFFMLQDILLKLETVLMENCNAVLNLNKLGITVF